MLPTSVPTRPTTARSFVSRCRRKEFVKLVRAKAEDAKVHVRGIRRKAKDDLDALKSDIGEDELARAEKELDALTRAHVDQIDEALKRKEAELLEV